MPRRIPSRTPTRTTITPPTRTTESEDRILRTYGRTNTDGSQALPATHRYAHARTTCQHTQRYGEATVWPADAALDHFIHCLTDTQRLDQWTKIMDACDDARRCFMADHAGRLHAIDAQMRAVMEG